MLKYFDKNFFRLFTKFMMIIVVSMTIILATKIYQHKSEKETFFASVIKSFVP